MRILITFSTIALLVLGGCATRASGVVPMAISAAEFASLSCDETKTALAAAREREIVLSRQQNTAATVDAIGVFLVAVPASTVFGGNKEGDLARAKGEAMALERAIGLNCPAGTQVPQAGQ